MEIWESALLVFAQRYLSLICQAVNLINELFSQIMFQGYKCSHGWGWLGKVQKIYVLNLFASLLIQGSDGPVGPRGQPGEPVSIAYLLRLSVHNSQCSGCIYQLHALQVHRNTLTQKPLPECGNTEMRWFPRETARGLYRSSVALREKGSLGETWNFLSVRLRSEHW